MISSRSHITANSTCHGHVDVSATELSPATAKVRQQTAAVLQAWNRLLTELKLLRSTASFRQICKEIYVPPDFWSREHRCSTLQSKRRSNSMQLIINATVTVTAEWHISVNIVLITAACKAS